jgi:hypothetical protein
LGREDERAFQVSLSGGLNDVRWRGSRVRNGREIGKDDPDSGTEGSSGCFGRLSAEDGCLRDRRTFARGRAPQGALLGVTTAAAGRVEVGTELVGVAVEMMEQSIGAWYGGTGAEEYGEEEERDQPLPHVWIIPGLMVGGSQQLRFETQAHVARPGNRVGSTAMTLARKTPPRTFWVTLESVCPLRWKLYGSPLAAG